MSQVDPGCGLPSFLLFFPVLGNLGDVGGRSLGDPLWMQQQGLGNCCCLCSGIGAPSTHPLPCWGAQVHPSPVGVLGPFPLSVGQEAPAMMPVVLQGARAGRGEDSPIAALHAQTLPASQNGLILPTMRHNPLPGEGGTGP